MSGPLCTEEERARIIEVYRETKSVQFTALAIRRSDSLVERILEEEGLRTDNVQTRDEITRNYWIDNDERFRAAMWQAINAGKERPPATTIFVDTNPPRPSTRFYQPVRPAYSSTSSPAAWCADRGDGVDRRPHRW